MKDIIVQISDDPKYCKGCKAWRPSHNKIDRVCVLADIYDGSGRDGIAVCKMGAFDFIKCRWCLETYPCEEK